MIDFEKEILNTVRTSLSKSIEDNLTGYGAPMRKMCEEVIEQNRDKIKRKLDLAFNKTMDSRVFEEEIQKAFNHKLARILVERTKGNIEKAANEHWSDASMRAKMILAIENIIQKAQPND